MKTYPAINFVARHGRWLAWSVGGSIASLSVVGYASGAPTGVLVAGLTAAVALFAVVRVGAEIIEVISETLLPR